MSKSRDDFVVETIDYIEEIWSSSNPFDIIVKDKRLTPISVIINPIDYWNSFFKTEKDKKGIHLTLFFSEYHLWQSSKVLISQPVENLTINEEDVETFFELLDTEKKYNAYRMKDELFYQFLAEKKINIEENDRLLLHLKHLNGIRFDAPILPYELHKEAFDYFKNSVPPYAQGKCEIMTEGLISQFLRHI